MQEPGAAPDEVDGGTDVESRPEVAATVFGDRLPVAERYVAVLAGDGIVRGLIGPRERSRLWSRHVVNSALPASLLPADGRVVDVGSGAGLPGIPMAIARPDCAVVLVEPLIRRVDFLREVVAELGLDNCRVVRGRADEVVDQAGDADVVTSRAVAPLGRLALWCAPLVRVGGEMIALKGSSAEREIIEHADALAAVGLGDVRVETVGVDLVTDPTVVVRAVRRAGPARPAGPRRSPAGRRSVRRTPRRR
ncbi:16S rRNA (guanine(527)-N(7))-methyltransferase RsmG [Nakamurella leprariae]|uniref:Ribosomal RNA small subunit methyltransferase G n=1 Tax=Nakamurella leprariae TaxID=2803911 RepID=A0A938YJE6_9ACTN|nr:16S rRNA (guanine(527)-N(7))-methyltransferase RsmG [Nakamurella leprariae]MBM9468963.1 16S rRNA (guanine(527)-N(7))-methyltransferase RsmG [Nakamurella leprariae]